MGMPLCTSCGARLGLADLRETQCPHCAVPYPETADAVEAPLGAPAPPTGPKGQYALPIYPTPYAQFDLNALHPPSSENPRARGAAATVLVIAVLALVAALATWFLLLR